MISAKKTPLMNCEIRHSLKTVQVWNRTGDKAQQLCDSLAGKFPNVSFEPVADIEPGARQAGGEVQGGGGLSDPPFLVGDAYDLCHSASF